MSEETRFGPAEQIGPTLTITPTAHGQTITQGEPPRWTTEQKDAVMEFARFLHRKLGLAQPRIYIEYADEFLGAKEPPR